MLTKRMNTQVQDRNADIVYANNRVNQNMNKTQQNINKINSNMNTIKQVSSGDAN